MGVCGVSVGATVPGAGSGLCISARDQWVRGSAWAGTLPSENPGPCPEQQGLPCAC